MTARLRGRVCVYYKSTVLLLFRFEEVSERVASVIKRTTVNTTTTATDISVQY
jgi:hypothetical protein